MRTRRRSYFSENQAGRIPGLSALVIRVCDRIVQKFATDVVGPKVREMDENEAMDPAIIQGLFDQGVGELRFPVVPCKLILPSSAHGNRNKP
jgi:hypothetical protein